MQARSLIIRASLVLVLAAALALPSRAQSEEHITECTQLFHAAVNAEDTENGEQMVVTARKYMTVCRDAMNADQEAGALTILGEGLGMTGHPEDGIPIEQRCISLKPDAADCFYALGWDYEKLGKTDEAISAFKKAVAIGGYDDVSAVFVKLAKKELEAFESSKAKTRASEDTAPPAPEPPHVIAGSGFVVSESGFILTNDHVAGHCTEAHTGDGQALKLIAASSDFDLALLKMNRNQTPSGKSSKAVATFRPGAEAPLGASVITFGYPLEGLLSSHGNVSTGIIAAESGIGDDKTYIQISAPVQPGNSGGPVLDMHGNVVGVVESKLDAIAVAGATGSLSENVNFAVRESVVRKFLADAGLAVQSGPPMQTMTVADIAARAEQFSIPITCVK
jgi:S1-C subfamily serine protease